MSKRNLFFVVFAGLAPFAMPAMAADVAQNYAPQQFSDAPYDWSGMYAGIHLGSASSGFPNPFADKSSTQFGGQVGTNFQSGVMVYGAELEGSYSGGSKYDLGRGAELRRTWNGAAKARAGVSLDRTLVYGTAGYSMAKFKAKGNVISEDKWEGGYLIGGGVEQAFAGGISARAEYNYVNYGDVNAVLKGGTRTSVDAASHSVKLGLNYRF
ncbi:outer membrane protein [Aminobacter sp. AP02]|uniref:outer membrane protein n=1 Tax=Aminobacter sp. AP02 TaxID=2135737 RepID=UPI000D6CBFCE|nr:outer membrane protein [Aminobacter sp. AP02]PWK75653.1 outer membrane immunogenic protein [Aminobacter sp. AP02]